MNDIVNIFAYEGPGGLSNATWAKLKAVSPRMCKDRRTQSDYRDTGSSEVIAFLRGCESNGLSIGGVDQRDYENGVSVKIVRRYNQQDLESAPFMLLKPVEGHPNAFMKEDPKGRCVFQGRQKPSVAIFEREDDMHGRLWMRSDAIEKLRVASWKEVKLRGALRADRAGNVLEGEWAGVKELYSDVVLPPMVHEIARFVDEGPAGQHFVHGAAEDVMFMVDPGYADYRPRFYESEMCNLASWDIACSFEYSRSNFNRSVFVSHEVYQIFKDCNMTELCKWIPAEVVKGDRPKNAGLVRLEGRPPPKKFW